MESTGISSSEQKPRIALVADVRNWALANIALQIQKNLGNKYEFEIYYYGEYRNVGRLFPQLFCNNFNAVHFLWRECLFSTLLYVKNLGKRKQEKYIDCMTRIPVTFSIYDHCFLNEEDIYFRKILFDYAYFYTVSSDKLYRIYESIEEYKRPFMIIEDGVDLDLFYPSNTERLSDKNRDIAVGWVGNSRWWSHDGIDHKGLNTIIKPAIETLRKEKVPVVGTFADRNVKFIPFEKMVDYYNSIDICVCASDMEGTPNPVLEAMACGIPVVSTDVGIVPQVFGQLQSEFIMKERSKEALKEKLRLLVSDSGRRKAISEENLKQIVKWTREEESKKWDTFFGRLLNYNSNQNHETAFSPISNDELRRMLYELHLKKGRLVNLLLNVKLLLKMKYYNILSFFKYK